jgi:hypothetical protein
MWVRKRAIASVLALCILVGLATGDDFARIMRMTFAMSMLIVDLGFSFCIITQRFVRPSPARRAECVAVSTLNAALAIVVGLLVLSAGYPRAGLATFMVLLGVALAAVASSHSPG